MSTSSTNLFNLLGRVQIITSTTVEGALYGFAFALYISCARLLYLQLDNRDRRKQNLFTILYMSLIMIFALCGFAMDSTSAQISYIDHADYPGTGGFGYSQEILAHSPTAIAEYVLALLSQLMMSGIQIWRLWIVWGASRYSLLIIVVPVLSFFVDLGFQMASLVILASRMSNITPQLGRLLLYGQFIPQSCISAAVTIPIVVRILIVRRRNMQIMDQTTQINNTYTSIISILIESFALEFVWIIVQIPLTTLESSANPSSIAAENFISQTLVFIQLLSYLLVVYRVTVGRAWKEDTEERLTTLEWNREGLQTTQSGTRTSITGITHEEA